MNFRSITSNLVLTLVVASSLIVFTWPLFIEASGSSESEVAQAVFILLMPLLIVLVLVETISGNFKPQQLAVLAVLIALNALIRMFGAGFAGIETAFFLIIISGYVFGPKFGFALGSLSLFVSALLTGGVGPWLPFQMMAAGLVGVGAGLLPNYARTWAKVSVISIYALFASFLYGALMTLWNWPFLAGADTSLSYVAGAGLVSNLETFLQYQILTGGLFWDAGRAVTTIILILVTGPALLTTLNRAATKSGAS